VPTIAGMSAWYLSGQLTAYQKGERPCPKLEYKSGDTSRPKTDMCDIAKKLSKDDVDQVTSYFENQTFVAAKQPFDAAKAAAGKKLHNGECEKCHSDGGSEAMDDAGILAGQWKAYLKDTFAAYQSGKRLPPEKMKPKIDKLTPAEVDELIEFYASEGSK
jgi:sulfide dehydrogenase cytochrome subunit